MLRPNLISRALKSERPVHEEFIDVVYRGLLGRNVDTSGLATYTKLIEDRTNPDALVEMIASIASSEEALRHRG